MEFRAHELTGVQVLQISGGKLDLILENQRIPRNQVSQHVRERLLDSLSGK
jgi:hypothetical protein